MLQKSACEQEANRHKQRGGRCVFRIGSGKQAKYQKAHILSTGKKGAGQIPAQKRHDEQQANQNAPKIIAGAVQPEICLAKTGRKHPNSREDSKEQQVVVFILSQCNPIYQMQLDQKNKGIDHVENRLWEKLKQLNECMCNNTAIGHLIVRRHGR